MTAGHTVVAIVPQTFEEYYRYAVMAVKSGIMPWDCKTPENAMARLLHGAELGLKPMQSLQSIAVINGRPSVWGDAALAICLEVLDEFEEIYSNDPTEGPMYTCRAVRTRGKTKRTVTHTYSKLDAETAKLWGKQNKSYKTGEMVDSPWVTNPKRMLQMRARGFTLRDICPDMLKGMHLKEEIDDLPPEEGQQPLREVTPGQTVASSPQREEIDAPSPPAVDGEIVQDHVDISSQETNESPPSPSAHDDPPSPAGGDRAPSAAEGMAAQLPHPPQEDAAPPSPTPPVKPKNTRGPGKKAAAKATETAAPSDPGKAYVEAFEEDPPDPRHAEDFYKFVETKFKAVPQEAGEDGLLEVWTKYVNRREVRTKILPPDMTMLGDLYGRYQRALTPEE